MSDAVTDRIDVAYVARLARLELSQEELQSFQSQLQDIVGYVKKVRELDVSSIEPMSHGIPVHDVFRKDEPAEGLPQEVELANAPSTR